MTNIKNSYNAVNLNFTGDLNLTNLNFSGKIISATSLTANNDLAENVKILNYAGLNGNMAMLPPYSIIVLKGTKNPNSINSDQGCNSQLINNYPNPFNSTTMISYDLPNSSIVKILIYNARGETIQQLVKNQPAGKHILEFDAGNLHSGVYYCQIEVNQKKSVHRMLLLK